MVTGERICKDATDTENEQPCKAEEDTDHMESRVSTARSIYIDKRGRELAQDAFDEYMSDKIDSPELNERKKAAREQAARENAPLEKINRVYCTYTAAKKARIAAECEENAAEDALELELRSLGVHERVCACDN